MKSTPEHITVKLRTKAEISGDRRNEPSSAKQTGRLPLTRHQKPWRPEDGARLAAGIKCSAQQTHFPALVPSPLLQKTPWSLTGTAAFQLVWKMLYTQGSPNSPSSLLRIFFIKETKQGMPIFKSHFKGSSHSLKIHLHGSVRTL